MRNLMSIMTTTTVLIATPLLAQDTQPAGYCENAFFSVETDEDEMVSADESAAMGDAVFEELDLNDSGAIERDEYVACTERKQENASGMMPTEADEDMFADLDADQDSRVSAREYFEQASAAYDESMGNDADSSDMTTGFEQPFVYLPQDTTAEQMGLNDKQRFLDLAALTFAMTDTDFDGILTEDEWAARADQSQVDISRANQRFDAADSDGDDALNPEEFGVDWQAVTGAASGKADKDGFTDQSKGIPAYYFYISAM